MANVTDNQIIEGLMDTASYKVTPTVLATSATTTTLAVSSTSYYIFTGTTAGQIVKLGNATTYLIGHTYLIHNHSTQVISITDNSDALLLNVEPDQRTEVILQDNSSAAGIWVFTLSISDPIDFFNSLGTTSRFSDFDQIDFHQHHIFHFTNITANGGVVTVNDGAPTDNTWMGLVTIATGTTSNATGRAVLDGNSSVNNVKVADLSCEWRIRLPVLSTGTIGYRFRVGLQDVNTAGDPANGVYFYYSEDVNSGRWRGVTRNASTSTNVDSTAITVAANTWYKLRFASSNNGATVNFYVNNILIGTSTTNIPTTNATRVMAKIEKKAPSSTTSRIADLDWLVFGVTR